MINESLGPQSAGRSADPVSFRPLEEVNCPPSVALARTSGALCCRDAAARTVPTARRGFANLDGLPLQR